MFYHYIFSLQRCLLQNRVRKRKPFQESSQGGRQAMDTLRWAGLAEPSRAATRDVSFPATATTSPVYSDDSRWPVGLFRRGPGASADPEAYHHPAPTACLQLCEPRRVQLWVSRSAGSQQRCAVRRQRCAEPSEWEPW